MKISNVKIISDGTPLNTHAFVDGKKIKGIKSIEISIVPDDVVHAVFTIIGADLDIIAEQVELQEDK